MKRTLLGFVFILVGSLTSCVDDNYDLSKIDLTIGVGGSEFSFPLGSTDSILLSNVLELEETGLITINDEGDYLFVKENEVNEYTTFVNLFRFDNLTTEVNGLDIRELLTSSGAKSKGISRIPSTEGSFDIHVTNVGYITRDIAKEIVTISHATSKGGVELEILGVNCDEANVSLRTLTLTLPKLFRYGKIQTNMDATQEKNVFTFKNLSLENGAKVMIPIEGVYPDEKGENETWTFDKENHTVEFLSKITAKGELAISDETLVWLAANPSKPLTLKITPDFSELSVVTTTGKIDLKVDFTVDPIVLVGLPDFLQDEEVKLDIANPLFYLSVNNNTPGLIHVNGTLSSIKDEVIVETIKLSKTSEYPIKLLPNSSTTICLSRVATGDENNLVIPELGNLLLTIPDKIQVDIEAASDQTQNTTIKLGNNYSIESTYKIESLLSFGERTEIVYKDTLNGWNKELSKNGITLKDKETGYVEITATIYSQVPLDLNLETTAIKTNGEKLENVEIIVVDNRTIAGGTAANPSNTDVVIRIRELSDTALQQLDGIMLRASAKSSRFANTPLKASQFLRFNDVKVTLKGGLILDLN